MSGGSVSRGDSSLDATRMEVLSRGLMDGMFEPQLASRAGSRGSMRSAMATQRPTSETSLEVLSSETPSQLTATKVMYSSSDSSNVDEEDDVNKEQQIGMTCQEQNNKCSARDVASPADSEWDRILTAFEQQQIKINEKEGGGETQPLLVGDGTSADSFWVLQGEEESSSDGSSDLGEFVDDLKSDEMEDSGDKNNEKVHNRPVQISQNEEKIAKALAKIRKLDKVLAQKEKKEKQVKQQRMKIENELQQLEDKEKEERHRKQQQYGRLTDRQNPKDKHTSTDTTTEHNESTDTTCMSLAEVTDLYQSQVISPVFTTQLGDIMESRLKEDDLGSTSLQSEEFGEKMERYNAAMSDTGERQEVDFIRRNIQLAADAGSAVAMTDEEKERLDELLADLTDDKDSDKHDNTEAAETQLMFYGQAFIPAEDEARELAAINSQLNALVPGGNWEERSSSVTSLVTSSSYQSASAVRENNTEVDVTEDDDKCWNESHNRHELQVRLRDIDEQLEYIKASRESEDTMMPQPMNEDQLQALIKQCIAEQQELELTTDAITSSHTKHEMNCHEDDASTQHLTAAADGQQEQETLAQIAARINSEMPPEVQEFIKSAEAASASEKTDTTLDVTEETRLDDVSVEDLDD